MDLGTPIFHVSPYLPCYSGGDSSFGVQSSREELTVISGKNLWHNTNLKVLVNITQKKCSSNLLKKCLFNQNGFQTIKTYQICCAGLSLTYHNYSCFLYRVALDFALNNTFTALYLYTRYT